MFDKLNIKLLIISFIIGMIFSILIGGIFKVPFFSLILRSVIAGTIVSIVVFCIIMLINNFLPELTSGHNSDSSSIIGEESEENPLGQNVNIVLDEDSSSETQFDHKAMNNSPISNLPENKPAEEGVSNDISETEQNVENLEELPQTNSELNMNVEPASIDRAIKKGEAPMAASKSEFKAQSLPDIGSLADNMGSLSLSAEEQNEEVGKISHRPRTTSSLGNDEMLNTVKQNESEDMAKAIRTVIKREEG